MISKTSNIWKLNGVFLNIPWMTEEIGRKIRKYFKLNANENTSKFVRRI